MTREEAIEFSKTGSWLALSWLERAEMVLREDKLCMPWEVFHAALQDALERPVFTHEIGLYPEQLLEELTQKRRRAAHTTANRPST